jgi:Heparinase II/III-like protein/Alginate lyase
VTCRLWPAENFRHRHHSRLGLGFTLPASDLLISGLPRLGTGFFVFLVLTVAVLAPAAADGPIVARYQYDVGPDAANIALTAATAPHTGVEVFGTPRRSLGHPDTLWDAEDIEHYKETLKSNAELRAELAELRKPLDERLDRPLDVPAPQKGPNGAWLFPGDYFPPFPGAPPEEDSSARFRRYLSRDSEAIANLGILFVLTGEEKYAAFAKSLLLAYAHASQFGARPGLDYRFNQGFASQLLEDALILDKLAWGYDLIYDFSGWAPDERRRVHDELIRPLAAEMLYPGVPEKPTASNFASQVNNRGVIGAASVLWAGYATDDEELVQAALYGVNPLISRSDLGRRRTFPPPQDWSPATPETPTSGLVTVAFSPVAIPEGMWVEPSPGYAFYVLGSMVDAAEIGWHHGLDFYRAHDDVFKYMFDFPLLFAYPDFTLPAEGDSHRDYVITNLTASLYDYAYRRYRDPRYLDVIAASAGGGSRTLPPGERLSKAVELKGARHLDLTHIGSVPPSFLYDLGTEAAASRPRLIGANFPGAGFGILRLPSRENGISQLVLSYGPSASHGHPDKLSVDLFANGDVLMPSPGVDYPYFNNDRIPNWYHTTLSHNTLAVDEGVQSYDGSGSGKGAHANQLAFAPSAKVGLQRASTDSAYDGVMLDRAVFLTDGYLADLFGAFSTKSHTFDLAWHIRGQPSSQLSFAPFSFGPAPAKGYSVLRDVRAAEPGSDAFAIDFTQVDHVSRLMAPMGESTKVIVGDGGFFVDFTSSAPHARPEIPTVIERRAGLDSTVFANVLDLSGERGGFVKNVAQIGGPQEGFALMRIETSAGMDVCYAAYDRREREAAGLKTDALQAFVRLPAKGVDTLYLVGGRHLEAGGGYIERSESGLAYVERTEGGGYEVGNPSPTPATITLRLPGVVGAEASMLGAKGEASGHPEITRGPNGEFSFRLEAQGRMRLTPK